jgi:hypothetical protein
MAEIAKIESGRVGVNNAPSAALPVVNYPAITPEIALIGQAKYQGTVADKLSRMSSILYNEGQQLSQRAGLQFAAENPMTKDQLIAMSKGDMSTVALGSPINVFDSAVRKVRAFELSAHAESEAIPKLEEIQMKAQMGQLDFEQVRDQIKSVTDGYGSALAEVDPESAFKYRATLATVGNKIIEETAKNETKKRFMANQIKVERNYQSFLRMAEQVYDGQTQLDPTTGQVISKDDVVDALAGNFLSNTIALVGVNNAAAYQTKVIKDLTDTKTNALAKYIADDFGQDPEAFMKLRSGDAGRLTDIYQSLGEDGKTKVMQTLFTKVGTQNNARKEMDDENKTARELEGIDLFKKLDSASGAGKKAIIKRLSELRIVSFEQLNTLSKGGGESNPMALFNATVALYDGTITNTDQIAKLPISAKDKLTLLGKFHSNDKSDDRDLDSGIRRLAGVPIGMNFVDPKGSEFTRKAQLDREAEQVRQELISQGKPSNSKAILAELSKGIEAKKTSEGAKAARASLKPYEDKVDGVQITSSNYDAFAMKVKAGKVKNVTEKDLPRIKSLVEKAEGIQ